MARIPALRSLGYGDESIFETADFRVGLDYSFGRGRRTGRRGDRNPGVEGRVGGANVGVPSGAGGRLAVPVHCP